MTFRVKPEAEADAIEAIAWQFRRQRYSAAAGPHAEWEAGQSAIEAMPRLYPPADDAPAGREIRNYLTRRYGYRIVYEVTPTETVVLAFVCARRRPAAWLGRLTP